MVGIEEDWTSWPGAGSTEPYLVQLLIVPMSIILLGTLRPAPLLVPFPVGGLVNFKWTP